METLYYSLVPHLDFLLMSLTFKTLQLPWSYTKTGTVKDLDAACTTQSDIQIGKPLGKKKFCIKNMAREKLDRRPENVGLMRKRARSGERANKGQICKDDFDVHFISRLRLGLQVKHNK